MAVSTKPSANNWGENRNSQVVEWLNKGLMAVSQGGDGSKYDLFATVAHHGRSPSGGHYTADARRYVCTPR
eukprot:6958569-Pyramimonas_sp.AAC.1